jgi:hypothetical protein
MRHPWNDAQFIGIVRDGTSRLSTGPSGDVSATGREADDPVVKNDMLELALVCEEVANDIEDHLTGG